MTFNIKLKGISHCDLNMYVTMDGQLSMYIDSNGFDRRKKIYQRILQIDQVYSNAFIYTLLNSIKKSVKPKLN